MPDADQQFDFIIAEQFAGVRLDAYLAEMLPEFSRVRIRRAISAGDAMVDEKKAKPSYRLKHGQAITIKLGPSDVPGPDPEPISLDILFEDEHLAAINKPPGMVVHQAKGHWTGTLAAAVSHHFLNVSNIGGPARPGIVHRLDRDTSGVILIAKTDQAHLNLANQFSDRKVQKEYFAIVSPAPDRDRDRIEKTIGVHPYQREKMTVRDNHPTCRDAETFYEVLQRFGNFASVKVLPRTGRTHQIRVHLAHIGCPVIADKLYSGQSQITIKQLDPSSDSDEVVLSRQALHARRISFAHPDSGEELEISAELPRDLQSVLDTLAATTTGGEKGVRPQ